MIGKSNGSGSNCRLFKNLTKVPAKVKTDKDVVSVTQRTALLSVLWRRVHSCSTASDTTVVDQILKPQHNEMKRRKKAIENDANYSKSFCMYVCMRFNLLVARLFFFNVLPLKMFIFYNVR